jgi:FlaA1/EpsC-like NDP-sugar epimerase
MFSKVLTLLVELPRWQKRTIQIVADVFLLTASFLLAMYLRLDQLTWAQVKSVWLVGPIVFPLSILVFIRLGFYRAVTRYISTKAASTILSGIAASIVLMLVVSQGLKLPVPRSVPFIYGGLALLLVGGARFFFRNLYQRSQARLRTAVLIIGAGETARQISSSMLHSGTYSPKALVDPDGFLVGTQIAGLPVHSLSDLGRLIEGFGIEIVLLAIPKSTQKKRLAIVELLEEYKVQVKTLPTLNEMISGDASLSQVRPIEIEDILGRDPVEPNKSLLGAQILDKSVLVTGAGGSIGGELCRQIIRQKPGHLVLFESSEYSLYKIEREIEAIQRRAGTAIPVSAILGSVLDESRVTMVINDYRINTIYHAAAYKHVPLVEQNTVEGVKNNLRGTRIVAKAAVEAGVKAFILISTDKAVRPTNVMGTSKRLAELVCQAYAAEQNKTLFAMVRFGNVLGSSGSVVPLFRSQIEAGGPISITHPAITRYFMTIPEAAELVIQAGSMASGGDVFVLDMGQPVKIVDLASRMVRLAGQTPILVGPGEDPAPKPGQIMLKITGLRSGEKLYEELLVTDSAEPTQHPRISRAHEDFLPWPKLLPILTALDAACDTYDLDKVRAVMLAAPTGFAPTSPIVDHVWVKRSERLIEQTRELDVSSL